MNLKKAFLILAFTLVSIIALLYGVAPPLVCSHIPERGRAEREPRSHSKSRHVSVPRTRTFLVVLSV
jgi:hypothetical protein